MKRGIFIFLLLFFFLFPLIILGVQGVSGMWSFPHVFPESFSLRGLDFLWTNRTDLLLSILSSVGYSLAAAAVTFILCYFPASVLAFNNFRGKTAVETILILPAILPAMTFAVGVHVAFIFLSAEDSWFGIVAILSLFSYPYMLRALIAGFKAVGRDLTACAKNLGAGPLRRISLVEIPALAPSIYAGGAVVFLVAFSEYFLVFLVGGGAVPSITSYLVPFLNASDFTVSSLLVLLFSAAPIFLLLGTERFLRGLYAKRGLDAV